jgi:ribonuclease E
MARAKSGERGRKTAKRARTATSTKTSGSAPAKSESTATREMIINVSDGEECRIAVLNKGRLEELYLERQSSESHVGNIYKGRVTNVEPSIQAAFIDFGLPKNGFLHISDLQPQYFPDKSGKLEEVGKKVPRRDRPLIQHCLKRGQEVVVQVMKEGIGTKGPTLSTYLSIPGRYLVMMPGMNRIGVSRKIEDDEQRRKMRDVLKELELPTGIGFILRTAGIESTKGELHRDLQYLKRLWSSVAKRIKSLPTPAELYQESDLVIRTIRDVYSSDFKRVIVDNEIEAEKIRDFLSIAMPATATNVESWKSKDPLFHKYGIEEEIDKINARTVPLKSGGSLVIESTEAMVTIDVNSGKYREGGDAEESAYRLNMEAAEEIARQLKLRDLGGLILCDFVDMLASKHKRAVERVLHEALVVGQKERAKILRMSDFGIIEMTRQRKRPSIKRSIYHDCPQCNGSGLVKTPESVALHILRLLRVAINRDKTETVEVRVSPTVGTFLLNKRRETLYEMETQSLKKITIVGVNDYGLDRVEFDCRDAGGREIPFSV